MFVIGTSWRKKLLGTAVVYLIFLALGLVYASRIFHEPDILNDALITGAVVVLPLIVWGKYKIKTDPDFAARAAQRKNNPQQQAKAAGASAPLYIILFHLLFLALVLAFKYVLDHVAAAALTRKAEIVLATMAATALASAAMLSLVGYNDRRRKAQTVAQP